jgi:hypothetical protein
MIFGLSNARVGATLAIVLVGYNIILGETDAGVPIRLLGEDILNGTILMILVTCTISSFSVEKAARKLALNEESKAAEKSSSDEKILISLAYPDTVEEMVDFGLMLKPKKSDIPVYALHIISDETDEGKTHVQGKKMMDRAVKHAAGTENVIIPLTRFDMNISNGIIYTIKEQRISDVLIGLHHSANQSDFLGPIAERILHRTSETIFIYKSVQPFNTLKRMVVAVTPKAELEPGFSHWLSKLVTLAKESALSLAIYANELTTKEIEDWNRSRTNSIKIEFNNFINWDDFLIFTRELKSNDLFVIVSSRKGHHSYTPQLDKLPYYLSNYFKSNSFIMVYPNQLDLGYKMDDIQFMDGQLIDTITEKISSVKKAGSYIK